jgi:hypothetical protein
MGGFGYKIYNKSKLVAIGAVENVDNLANTPGFQVANLPMKYLETGLPLGASYRPCLWNGVIE